MQVTLPTPGPIGWCLAFLVLVIGLIAAIFFPTRVADLLIWLVIALAVARLI